jgi:NTP pyrophosphatase (non-canonical NTP hydrolase)
MSEYSLDDYQNSAFKFRVDDVPAEERVMGLLEEAGEVAGVFKRMLRGDYTEDVAASKLHKELGDILWYLSQIAVDNGWKLSEIAQENLKKLESRSFRGLILGTGSDR